MRLYSSRAIAILDHLGVKYESVDVLQDRKSAPASRLFRLADRAAARQGEFSAADIMMEMFQAGELQTLVDEAGRPRLVPSSLPIEGGLR
jgi:monothiol glutaredoxin